MDGILLVDKPAGWTSHDVVAKVRGIIRAETGQRVKVGHTGTLDPFATGLLLLVLGSYTKRAVEFSKLDKIYEAELVLGATSTTGDVEGKLTSANSDTLLTRPGQKCGKLPGVGEKEIIDILRSFIGEIEQTPPVYSAIKVNGQRAYKLARAGKEVEMKPRQVKIYELRIMNYEYPKVEIIAKVSSGTYIRSLAADIGKKLGTGAYLSQLRRRQVGSYRLKAAISIDNDTSYDIIASEIQTLP